MRLYVVVSSRERLGAGYISAKYGSGSLCGVGWGGEVVFRWSVAAFGVLGVGRAGGGHNKTRHDHPPDLLTYLVDVDDDGLAVEVRRALELGDGRHGRLLQVWGGGGWVRNKAAGRGALG